MIDPDVLAVAALEAALAHARRRLEPEVVLCVVCQMPRHPNHPDPLFDAIYHAQCDQRLAALDADAGELTDPPPGDDSEA